MKQLPNLLKQESSSASTLVNNLLRMYEDPRSDRQTSRASVLERFLPLSLNILHDFNALDGESQVRHIAAWSPVICEILGGYSDFDDQTVRCRVSRAPPALALATDATVPCPSACQFESSLPSLYPLLTDALGRENAPEVMNAVRQTFVRTGRVKGIVPA
jgi:brefeldin A-inhibited guanine nucleotide-exchange protein